MWKKISSTMNGGYYLSTYYMSDAVMSFSFFSLQLVFMSITRKDRKDMGTDESGVKWP